MYGPAFAVMLTLVHVSGIKSAVVPGQTAHRAMTSGTYPDQALFDSFISKLALAIRPDEPALRPEEPALQPVEPALRPSGLSNLMLDIEPSKSASPSTELEEDDGLVGSEKRSFQPWGGKRASFNPWGGKRQSFNPWGGKRAAFNAWGGKRNSEEYLMKKRPSFNPWGGKRADISLSSQENSESLQEAVEKVRRAFNPWGGKRSLNSWGGQGSSGPTEHEKRQSFNAWGGKRASFNAWGGKRSAAQVDEPSHLLNTLFSPWKEEDSGLHESGL
nr:leucokinin [Urechis unicinctus]